MDSNIKSQCYRMTLACTAFTALVSVMVLVGWQFDIPSFKTVLPNFISMKANTALCFLLLSVAIFLLRKGKASVAHTSIAFGCLGIITMISVLTLIQYTYAMDFGIDEFLYPDPEGVRGNFPPGRLAPITAICFILCSLAMFFMFNLMRPLFLIAHIMLLVVFLAAFQAVINYGFGIVDTFGVAFYTRMALHTATLFVVASAGIASIRPDQGFMKILMANSIGGQSARRMLLPALLIPTFTHWILKEGLEAGFYDRDFSVLLRIMGNTVFFAGVIWRNAVVLHRSDMKRQESDSARRQSEDHINQLNEVSPVLIFTTNPSGKTTYVNQRWSEYTGISNETLLKSTSTESYKLLHKGEEDLIRAMWRESIENKKPFELECRLRRHDGMYRRQLMRVVPLMNKDHEVIKWIGALTDIEESKRTEEYRIQLGQQKLKNEFISVVSHELRTPLTSIRGSLGLVASGSMGEIAGDAMGLIKIALSNSERLSRLINDILDIEKIESGGMVFKNQPLQIRKLIADALEAYQSYAEKYKTKFTVVGEIPDLIIYGDQDRMMQVFANLLSNAAKFSAEGRNVEVTSVREGDVVQFAIRNYGAVIPNEFRDKIFGKFVQADSSDSRVKDGTGLGLNITRSIIERLNGEVWFESDEQNGTAFMFELPLIRQNIDGSIQDEILGLTSKIKCTIRALHVEDDHDISRIVKRLMSDICQMHSCVSLAEARQAIRNYVYDIAVVDLKLADGSAMDLIGEIKESNPSCYVIVYSAYEVDDERLRKSDAVLIKSRVDTDQLKVWIEKAIRSKSKSKTEQSA